MTDVQLEDALQEFRAALVFTGAVGQAATNLLIRRVGRGPHPLNQE
jgi:hypothetical protein